MSQAKKTKIKMLIGIAGGAAPVYDLPDFAFAPGQVIEINATLAQIWIETGKAELAK